MISAWTRSRPPMHPSWGLPAWAMSRGRVRGPGGVPWRRLFGYLRPHWRLFSVAIVGLVIGSGLSLLVPLVVAGLVNAVVAGGDAAARARSGRSELANQR